MNLPKCKVLIIDDEPSIIQLIVDMLENEPYIFQSASTGYEGLIKVQTFTPDLILLDLKLGGQIDGLGVLKKIKETASIASIPVLIVSGQSNAVIQGFDLGAADFIYKPFTKMQLLEAFWRYVPMPAMH